MSHLLRNAIGGEPLKPGADRIDVDRQTVSRHNDAVFDFGDAGYFCDQLGHFRRHRAQP